MCKNAATVAEPAGWTIHNVNTWSQFTTLIDAIAGPIAGAQSRFLFRGQADAYRSLEPSILMALPSDIADKDGLAIEREAYDEFCKHEGGSARCDTVFDVWARMQHYGAPTRLLDWTTCRFVACYFAVESAIRNPGSVWVFDMHAVVDQLKERYQGYEPSCVPDINRFYQPDAEPLLFRFEPRNGPDRMGAQKGVFTASLRFRCDHAQVIAEALKNHRDRGGQGPNHKINIAKQSKPKFLSELREMDITARTLFPGLDGLGRYVNELINLRGLEKRLNAGSLQSAGSPLSTLRRLS
jgi:hypothetical protein